MRHNRHRQNLQRFYDGDVVRRAKKPLPAWKTQLREAFKDRLAASNQPVRLLEVGAGTGRDAHYFSEHGIEVIAVDLSEKMVARSRSRGIDSLCADMLTLAFADNAFQAVYAMNSLLHLSHALLPFALQEIRRVLAPGGLFYYGVYGGKRFEGMYRDDPAVTKRFFNYYTDDEIIALGREAFKLIEFRPISLDQAPYHFQAMIWQKPA